LTVTDTGLSLVVDGKRGTFTDLYRRGLSIDGIYARGQVVIFAATGAPPATRFGGHTLSITVSSDGSGDATVVTFGGRSWRGWRGRDDVCLS
jgi:hypothetical protein